MNYKVRSMFQNSVALPDKIVLKAIDNYEDIYFNFENKIMRIPWHKLDKLAKKGDMTFRDRFGKDEYKLWYYKWEPNIEQLPLI